jgi:hypothetical protein
MIDVEALRDSLKREIMVDVGMRDEDRGQVTVQISASREETFKEVEQMVDIGLDAAAGVDQNSAAGKLEQRGIGLVNVDEVDVGDIGRRGGGARNRTLRAMNESLIDPAGPTVSELNMVITVVAGPAIEKRYGLAWLCIGDYSRMTVSLLADRDMSLDHGLLRGSARQWQEGSSEREDARQ